jgi:hypothetical protein
VLITFYIPLGFIDGNYKRLKNQVSGKGAGAPFFVDSEKHVG